MTLLAVVAVAMLLFLAAVLILIIVAVIFVVVAFIVMVAAVILVVLSFPVDAVAAAANFSRVTTGLGSVFHFGACLGHVVTFLFVFLILSSVVVLF